MSANLFSLAGKTAIVTGGNVGLGQAIALALAEAGADIVSTSRRPAEETDAKVKALGRRRWGVAREQAAVVRRYGRVAPSAVVENAAELITGRNRDAR